MKIRSWIAGLAAVSTLGVGAIASVNVAAFSPELKLPHYATNTTATTSTTNNSSVWTNSTSNVTSNQTSQTQVPSWYYRSPLHQ